VGQHRHDLGVLAMFDFIKTRLATGARRLKAVRAAHRFVKRQEGSAAVEFGMVAAPFLGLLFAIMETALVFLAGQVLETAVADSSRLIMTGQAQSQGFSQSAFKSAVCSKIYGLFDCQGGVYVDVKTFTSFGGVTMTKPVDANGNFINDFVYQPGGPSDIVVVSLFYQWPVYVSLLGFSMQNMSGNKRLLIATAAFRNEPFGSVGAVP
jgi:Flp pilus assembly protein TadG